MTTDAHEPTPRELAALDALLASPTVWDDPPAGLEHAVVTAIAAEAARDAPAVRPRRRARWLAPAAAAALVVVLTVAALTFVGEDEGPSGVEFALAATGAAPGASAAATVSATPAGLLILLDVDGLPAAPPDTYYEAWISDGTTRVSAGTFHLREGDDRIGLWAGVDDPRFDRLAITLEPLDGVADSSGDVVLAGEFVLSD